MATMTGTDVIFLRAVNNVHFRVVNSDSSVLGCDKFWGVILRISSYETFNSSDIGLLYSINCN
jgi:hypothetical protein